MLVFKKWAINKYGEEAYNHLNPSGQEVIAEMDRLFKLRPEPKKERIYIDVKNGYGDLENARLRPTHIQEFRSGVASVAGYSRDVGE